MNFAANTVQREREIHSRILLDIIMTKLSIETEVYAQSDELCSELYTHKNIKNIFDILKVRPQAFVSEKFNG